MTEPLPSGWKCATVGELSTFVRGVTFKKSEASSEPSSGLVPIARAGNVESGRARLDQDLIYVSEDHVAKDQYLCTGDILVATSSGSSRVVGKSAIITEDWRGAHGAFMGVIRPKSEIYPAYLGFHIQSDFVRLIWRELAAGTNINNLKRDDIITTTVPLPPVAEQKRIADAIEEHFSRIDAVESAAQTALAKLDTLRRTVLTAAFSGRLVDQDPDDEPASVLLERIAVERPKRRTRHAAQSTNQGSNSMTEVLPPGWKWAAVNEVSHIVLGQSPPGSSYNDVGDGSPFFQGKAEFGSFYPEVRKWTTDPKKRAAAGSVLVSVRAPVGPTNIAPFDCAIGRGLAALHPLGGISTEYLLWAMRHTDTTLAKQGTGSTFDAITGAQLKIHHLPISPLAEQERIVAAIEEHFSRIDAAKASLRRCLQRCSVLRRAVLAAAFSGRLVEQDSNDEPASALLERIAAEQPKCRTRKKSA